MKPRAAHIFTAFFPRCLRCGLDSLNAGDIGAPACITDAQAEAAAEKRQKAELAGRVFRRMTKG